MNMKQQTAVEWIIEQLQAPCRGIPSHIIEQAKQMEMDQIEEAFYASDKSGVKFASTYYNETYGK